MLHADGDSDSEKLNDYSSLCRGRRSAGTSQSFAPAVMFSIFNSLSSAASSLQQYLPFGVDRNQPKSQDESKVQQAGRHVVLVGPSEPFCNQVAAHMLPGYQGWSVFPGFDIALD